MSNTSHSGQVWVQQGWVMRMIDRTDRSRSPQPNAGSDALLEFGWAFWAAILVTGVGAGLGAVLLMQLLRLCQEMAWGKGTGDFVLEGYDLLLRLARVLLRRAQLDL